MKKVSRVLWRDTIKFSPRPYVLALAITWPIDLQT